MGYKDKGKIKRIADERGVSPSELVAQAIAEHGSEFKAAIALGVYPNALRWYREAKVTVRR
jgi:uncharacterized protein YpmB